MRIVRVSRDIRTVVFSLHTLSPTQLSAIECLRQQYPQNEMPRRSSGSQREAPFLPKGLLRLCVRPQLACRRESLLGSAWLVPVEGRFISGRSSLPAASSICMKILSTNSRFLGTTPVSPPSSRQFHQFIPLPYLRPY